MRQFAKVSIHLQLRQDIRVSVLPDGRRTVRLSDVEIIFMSASAKITFRTRGLGADRMVGLHDARGRIRTINDVAIDRLGLSASDLIGRNWRDFTVASQRKREERAVDRVLNSGKPEFLIARRRFANNQSCSFVERVSRSRTIDDNWLIMREAYPLHDNDDLQIDGADDDRPFGFVASYCSFLKGLALQQEDTLLVYLLDAACLRAMQRERETADETTLFFRPHLFDNTSGQSL